MALQSKPHWIGRTIRICSFVVLFSVLPFAGGIHFGMSLGDRIRVVESKLSKRPVEHIAALLEDSSTYITDVELEALESLVNEPLPQSRLTLGQFKKEKSRVQKPLKKTKLVEIDGRNRYTLQYSSHRTQVDALAQTSRLKERNIPAFVSEANINNSLWYRVNIGKFATTKKARNFSKKLKKQSGIAATFVQNLESK